MPRSPPALPALLRARLPFYYGWVVLACLCCSGFARQGPAVATLSIFVEPLTHEFGWSRAALSGAVSLGGILAALAAPLIGPLLDRHGSRAMLCGAVLVTGVVLLLLSQTGSLLVFYLLFCIARMNWAGPFELAIYGAVNNWFIARRPFATSAATVAQMIGLAAMPLIAQLAIWHQGWRAGWLAIGATTLLVGLLPSWLLLVRRPEDLGLLPDGGAPGTDNKRRFGAMRRSAAAEPSFSRAQALCTPSFWLLLLYTVLVYPVQAGVSLHQAPHLIERGIDPNAAATIVSTFSIMSAVASLLCGVLPRALPIRFPLALTGAVLALSTMAMLGIASTRQGYLAAGLFGFGLGGLLTLLPMAWADYFGRANFGAIRGIALSAQVVAQAAGPLLSGVLRDWTGTYSLSLRCFAVLSCLSVVAVLMARPPLLSPAGSAIVAGRSVS
ncbi:MAG: MFS transporter [Alphaproteobacteria bacterium]|nr:MFS transporter [Alphaproteobacteria bacterium]MBV9860863.1 MFS transporter [Alphaproteobacteria bacterium]